MNKKLKEYFPLIRERKDVLEEIRRKASLWMVFEGWEKERQEEFLDYCTGVRGFKLLYDSFFKEVMNPEYAPERLESLLSAVLKRRVRIRQILPNDSTRIADESSLLITDIVVELEDRSLANVEIQKIGYAFPGARSACYSADMLLRQYRRVRLQNGKSFSYQDIKNVYLIVIYERSPREFHAFPDTYYHYSRQGFDSGLELDLLQEFVMIPLDIFRECMHNKHIDTPLEAWLTFLGEEEPGRIIELITKYPEFKAMYNTLYEMCRSMERLVDMFSKELKILDKNTERYMIEEQQKEIEEGQKQIKEQQKEIEEGQKQIKEQEERIEEQRGRLKEQEERIEEQRGRLKEQKGQIEEQKGRLEEQKSQIEEQQGRLEEQKSQIEEQKGRLEEQKGQIEEQKGQIEEQKGQIEEQKTENSLLKKQLEQMEQELKRLKLGRT